MGIWTCTVLAFSTFILINVIDSDHFIQGNQRREAKDYPNSSEEDLKKPIAHRQIASKFDFRHSMDIPSRCQHEDWPFSASVDQVT